MRAEAEMPEWEVTTCPFLIDRDELTYLSVPDRQSGRTQKKQPFGFAYTRGVWDSGFIAIPRTAQYLACSTETTLYFILTQREPESPASLHQQRICTPAFDEN